MYVDSTGKVSLLGVYVDDIVFASATKPRAIIRRHCATLSIQSTTVPPFYVRWRHDSAKRCCLSRLTVILYHVSGRLSSLSSFNAYRSMRHKQQWLSNISVRMVRQVVRAVNMPSQFTRASFGTK